MTCWQGWRLERLSAIQVVKKWMSSTGWSQPQENRFGRLEIFCHNRGEPNMPWPLQWCQACKELLSGLCCGWHPGGRWAQGWSQTTPIVHHNGSSMEEFLKLLRRSFSGDKPADIRAVLKRTVVLIFGQSALYLRLPSQKDDAPIHCIRVEDTHKDLLAEHDKVWYGK